MSNQKAKVGELADFLSQACSPKAPANSVILTALTALASWRMQESEEEMLDWSLEL